MFVHCACDRELALILLVVIGVSLRPHTLGCGCNCPLAGRPVTMWKLREEEWGGQYEGPFVCGVRHMSACVAVGELPGVEVWLWGDDCYSNSVAFKNDVLMGMHFTSKSQRGLGSQYTAAGVQKFSVCLRWETVH